MTARHNMTPEEFVIALEALGMTPTAFAKLIGTNDKNMRRAAEPGSDGPGPAASFALRCLLSFRMIAKLEDDHFAKSPDDFGRDGFIEVCGGMQSIAEEALRGEFPKIAGHRASTIIVDDPEG